MGSQGTRYGVRVKTESGCAIFVHVGAEALSFYSDPMIDPMIGTKSLREFCVV